MQRPVTANGTIAPPFTQLFRALPGLYLVFTPYLAIADATDSYLKTTHASRDAILGKKYNEVFPNNPATPDLDSAQNFGRSLQHVLQHKEKHSLPVLRYDILKPEKLGGGFETRYWAFTNYPVLDEEGNVLYIVHEACNITSQVENETSFTLFQEQLSLLTSALHAVTWELDITHNTIIWGGELQDIFGLQPEDLNQNADQWNKRIHPDDFKMMRESVDHAFAFGKPAWAVEYRFRKANGSYIPVLEQGHIIYDEHKKPVRTVGTVIDLSQSKQNNQNSQQILACCYKLLEDLPVMAYVAHPTGQLLYMNKIMHLYFGLPVGQTEGWITALHPKDSATILMAWNEAMATGNRFEREYCIRNSITNQYQYFLEQTVPMYDASGKINYWVGIFTDTDDHRQSLAQLQEKDEYLEQILAASPAHHCLFTGPHHICTYVTPGIYTLYGNRQYLGRPASEIWPELLSTNFIKMLDHVYQQGIAVRVKEYDLVIDRRQDGNLTKACFSFKYQPLLDSQNKVNGILASAIEITEWTLTRPDTEACT